MTPIDRLRIEKAAADCSFALTPVLDVFNGLLLAPHVDALFDGGWVSFEDSGAVLVSAALPADARERLGADHAETITLAGASARAGTGSVREPGPRGADDASHP